MATARFAALSHVGVRFSLASAVLFGAGTPAAKELLGSINPFMLAGLLYLGSGLGLWLLRLARRSTRVRLPRSAVLPLLGSVLSGGICGPVLLLLGLSHLPAAGASLLLNTEGVFTAALAWFVFRENFDKRIAAGMGAIVAGAVLLSLSTIALGSLWPSLAIVGACLTWAVDNNLTRTIALTDATWLAAVKGTAAGVVNLTVALGLGAAIPTGVHIAGAMVVGFFAYGLSLVLFIFGMRHLGTARAGGYFCIAPFFGAALSVLLGDPLNWPFMVAGALMAVGVWLHLTERHTHQHGHLALRHDHLHTHDEHHRHDHPAGLKSAVPHQHQHTHDAVTHQHHHYPDSHHRHLH